MNSTKTLAIVAVLTAATLVVGGTSAAMTTGHSAFAWKQDSYKNKRGDDSYKKVKQANGNYGNGNTNTAQVLKQNAKADKFSIVEQNGENSICTHPSSSSPDSTDDVIGSNPPGTCTSQSNQPLEVD
jgi:hypothetical protein